MEYRTTEDTATEEVLAQAHAQLDIANAPAPAVNQCRDVFQVPSNCSTDPSPEEATLSNQGTDQSPKETASSGGGAIQGPKSDVLLRKSFGQSDPVQLQDSH